MIKKSKSILWVVGTVIIIGGMVYATQQYYKNLPGTTFINQGREHLVANEPAPEYNSNPPTSGSHSEDWEKDWGIQSDYVEPEYQVHNLEHGGILVHYHPDRITNLSELEELFTELQTKNTKMLLIPNPTIDTVYALTAWTRLDQFDDYDAERIRAFTKAFYDKGPEKTEE